MTTSEYSHKNRKYKPLVQNGMKALLEFFQKLEETIGKNKQWKPQDLSASLEVFGDEISKIIKKKDNGEKSVYYVVERGPKGMWKHYLKIPPETFRIDRHVLKNIYKVLKMLKMDLADKNNDKVEDRKNMIPFLFLGENRDIHCDIVENITSLSEEDLNKFVEGTKVPAVYFEEMSIEAIKKGGDQQKIKDGVQIFTHINSSFTIIPVTDFADILLRSYFTSTLTPLDTAVVIRGKKRRFKHAIPSIFNEKHETLFQLICSLIVQYYISFGSFEAIKNCEICDALIYEKRKGKMLCNSGVCKNTRDTKNDPRLKAKRNCILRQNRWFERHVPKRVLIDGKLIGRSYANIGIDNCKECDLKSFPSGGSCPNLLRKYEKYIDRNYSMEYLLKRNN